jgi:hypothetical protein
MNTLYTLERVDGQVCVRCAVKTYNSVEPNFSTSGKISATKLCLLISNYVL